MLLILRYFFTRENGGFLPAWLKMKPHYHLLNYFFSSQKSYSPDWTPHPLNPIVTQCDQSKTSRQPVYYGTEKYSDPHRTAQKHMGMVYI
jgi:hypothetical protein